MYNLILIRHGQSEWNKQNRFTGWTDIDLTTQGELEAKRAAQLLKKIKFDYDIAFTSVLKRAIRTLWIILDEMNKMWTPVVKSWRLNERHYGELTGADKLQMIEQHGARQVHLWRRSYHTRPPEGLKPASAGDLKNLNPDHFKHPAYSELTSPLKGESLKDTKTRLLPFWSSTIAPVLKEGAGVLIVAHGNTLRALIKHIEHLNEEDITQVETPTGAPMAYQLKTSDLSIKTPRTLIK